MPRSRSVGESSDEVPALEEIVAPEIRRLILAWERIPQLELPALDD